MRYDPAELAASMKIPVGTALRQLGVSAKDVRDFRSRGMTARVAERLADKAGFNPYEVWPTWNADIAIAPLVCKFCGKEFFPAQRQPSQVYCSAQCRSKNRDRSKDAERERARYQENEAKRARKKETNAAYYAENGDYVRARQRKADRARRAREIEQEMAHGIR